MPKYYQYMIANHYLYFTSMCIVEAMHVHASDKKLSERDSAKFFVRSDGQAILKNKGNLTQKEINIITRFIKENYREMYMTWREFGGQDYYNGE